MNPYFALRSYQDGGEHYAGQIGDEPTPAAFVDSLLEVTTECMRVLKPSGSIWVNLGDKYVADNRGSGGDVKRGDAKHAPRGPAGFITGGMRQKSLMGIPWRYALRCIDDLGLILRSEVIWSKPNGLPESVTDRVRRSHETWFHFTINPRYFSAVDEIREEHLTPRTKPRDGGEPAPWGRSGKFGDVTGERHNTGNALGKLPGSVWTIPTQPLHVPAELGIDHFAAFPMEWPRRIIQGWSPAVLCVACGEGRRPVAQQTDAAYAAERARVRARRTDQNTNRESALYAGGRTNTEGFGLISNGVVKPSYAITGYACACPEPTADTRPGVILDPFGGTGTTALVAKALGRHGVSIDMSADYCRLAQWRTNNRGQMASALQVEKPDTIHPDQLDLFGDAS